MLTAVGGGRAWASQALPSETEGGSSGGLGASNGIGVNGSKQDRCRLGGDRIGGGQRNDQRNGEHHPHTTERILTVGAYPQRNA